MERHSWQRGQTRGMPASLSLLLPITHVATCVNQSMHSFPRSPLTTPELSIRQFSVGLWALVKAMSSGRKTSRPPAPTGEETYLPPLTRLQAGGLAVQLGLWGWFWWEALIYTYSGHEPLRQCPHKWLLHCEHQIHADGDHVVILNFDLPAFGTGLAQ